MWGLVEARQEGRTIIYSVPEGVRWNEIVLSVEKSFGRQSAGKNAPCSTKSKLRIGTEREDSAKEAYR